MKNSILVLVYLLGAFGVLTANLHSQEGTSAKQPVAPTRPVTDDYYGTKIVDNYRYMENLNDPEVQEWFKNQDAYTRATLASIPGRDKLLARIRELDTSAGKGHRRPTASRRPLLLSEASPRRERTQALHAQRIGRRGTTACGSRESRSRTREREQGTERPSVRRHVSGWQVRGRGDHAGRVGERYRDPRLRRRDHP